MATVPAPANLPLFYKDLVPLSSVDHADFRARPLDSAEFLVGQHAIPLTSDEFVRSDEHTSELQSLMRISYAVFSRKTNTVPTRDSSLHSDKCTAPIRTPENQ